MADVELQKFLDAAVEVARKAGEVNSNNTS